MELPKTGISSSMRNWHTFLFFVLLGVKVHGQIDCNSAFIQDTMSLPDGSKVLEGKFVITTLKDFSTVTLFRTNQDKFYLRFVVKKNFYFDKVDVLEIRSGSKSYYVKNTRQYKIDKTTGLFVVEIFSNYISTLKDEGITSLYFANAETDFTKKDALQIKQISNCFYELISTKNKH
ncbi:MAG: hypothetical protein JNL60_13665 [Bacteroidia bacterium]|nr:hypothetical protein [Bacteroidia bacterium]